MRKLIEISQEYEIVCDNINCDFKILNEKGNPEIDSIKYIDTPCPKCGHNLLTETDYLNHLKVVKLANWINKWFGWTTIFMSKKAEPTNYTVNTHKTISFKEK